MQASRFDDFDAFAASVRDADHAMMVVDVVRREWVVRHATFDGVHVQAGFEGGGNICEGRVRDDGHLLFVPLDRAETYAANGTPMDEESAFLIAPGGEFCLRSPVDHAWCSVFLPDERFGRVLREEDDSDAATIGGTRLLRAGVSPITRLTRAAMHALDVAERGADIESGAPGTSVADLLVRACREIVSPVTDEEGVRGPGRPEVPRDQIMRRVLAFVGDHPERALRVGDLAAAAGVSERTLRSVFQERFGIGPVRYLHLRQLHAVNRALRTAAPGRDTVTEVVRRFGVWELSRFARRYRAQFGELPSETLRAPHAG